MSHSALFRMTLLYLSILIFLENIKIRKESFNESLDFFKKTVIIYSLGQNIYQLFTGMIDDNVAVFKMLVKDEFSEDSIGSDDAES